MDHKIHIAYGFHVNCYHSYRGDTDDAAGFGSDLRIIRGIIRTLDELNAAGISVKGTWDSENFFRWSRSCPVMKTGDGSLSLMRDRCSFVL